MRRLSVAIEKVNALAAVLYLIGLALFYWTDYPDLWGGLLIITGVVWLIRQFLLGRMVDCLFVIIVFAGSWASHYWIFYPYVIIPALLAVGALYVIIEQIVSYWSQVHRAKRHDKAPSSE
jgi:hypothetical protein